MSAAMVAWSSRKASAMNANKEFARHAEKMAAQGYEVATVDTVPAGRSRIILGILNFVRGKQVQVVATFRRRDGVA